MMEGSPPSVLDFARFRQGAYRLLGSFFLHPNERDVPAAVEGSGYLRQRSPWAASLAFFGPWDDFLRCVGETTPIQVCESYLHVFGRGSKAAVLLHESAHLDQSVLTPALLFSELEGEYAAVGVRPSSPREGPDHAAVELEFVSFLCGQEAAAWEAGNAGGSLQAIRRQGKFLKQHLRMWFPRLARAVATRDGSGPHGLAVEAAHAMVAHDADFMEALEALLRTKTEAW